MRRRGGQWTYPGEGGGGEGYCTVHLPGTSQGSVFCAAEILFNTFSGNSVKI